MLHTCRRKKKQFHAWKPLTNVPTQRYQLTGSQEGVVYCAATNTKHSLREKRLNVHKPTRRDAKPSQLGTRRLCLSRGEIPTLLRVFQADSYTNKQSGRSGVRRGARLQPGRGIRGERLAVCWGKFINKKESSQLESRCERLSGLTQCSSCPSRQLEPCWRPTLLFKSPPT